MYVKINLPVGWKDLQCIAADVWVGRKEANNASQDNRECNTAFTTKKISKKRVIFKCASKSGVQIQDPLKTHSQYLTWKNIKKILTFFSSPNNLFRYNWSASSKRHTNILKGPLTCFVFFVSPGRFHFLPRFPPFFFSAATKLSETTQ